MDYMNSQGYSGKSYYVEKNKFAGGGEGTIHRIQGHDDQVAKIFREDKRTREREEKLRCMVKTQLTQNQLDDVTWPLDVIYDTNGFVGYIMPKLKNTSSITALYSSGSTAGFDLRYRLLAAINLCYALKTIHSMNQVCGDFNPQNICINLDEKDKKNGFHVTLVDTDSYHFTTDEKTYRCEVGLSDYIAPELQKKMTNGNTLKTAELPTYTRETDLFALAVHIFALLMNGCHPFACAKSGDGGMSSTIEQMKNTTVRDSVVAPQPIENIKDGFFPFDQSKQGISIPIYAPQFSSLPLDIQNLFIRTFEVGYSNPICRVSTEEWIEVLSKYISADKYLECKNKHYYFKENGAGCPFCAVNEKIVKMIGKGSARPHPSGEKGLIEKTPSYIIPPTKSMHTTLPNDNVPIFKSSGTGGGMYTPEPDTTKKTKKIVAIAVACAVIAAIIIFIIISSSNDDSDTETAANDATTYQTVTSEETVSDEEDTVDMEDVVDAEDSADTDDTNDAADADNVDVDIDDLEEICAYLESGAYGDAYNKLVSMSAEGTSNFFSIYYKDTQLYNEIEDGNYLYVHYDILSPDYYIYQGNYSYGEQDGRGVEIGTYNNGYYFVDGYFADGYANGQCWCYYSDKEFMDGEKYSVAIEGNFTDGYEDGTMSVTYYYEDDSLDNFTRSSDMGTFEVISYEDGRYIYMKNADHYVYFEDEDGLYDNGCPNRKRT